MSKSPFYGHVYSNGVRFEAELPGFLTTMYDRESTFTDKISHDDRKCKAKVNNCYI